jgi:hypothetical protein
LSRVSNALKPGRTLVINDFILNDGRTSHPFAMTFAWQMLVFSKNGFTHQQCDYREWLGQSGFRSVEIMPRQTPATLVFASYGPEKNDSETGNQLDLAPFRSLVVDHLG